MIKVIRDGDSVGAGEATQNVSNLGDGTGTKDQQSALVEEDRSAQVVQKTGDGGDGVFTDPGLELFRVGRGGQGNSCYLRERVVEC